MAKDRSALDEQALVELEVRYTRIAMRLASSREALNCSDNRIRDSRHRKAINDERLGSPSPDSEKM